MPTLQTLDKEIKSIQGDIFNTIFKIKTKAYDTRKITTPTHPPTAHTHTRKAHTKKKTQKQTKLNNKTHTSPTLPLITKKTPSKIRNQHFCDERFSYVKYPLCGLSSFHEK